VVIPKKLKKPLVRDRQKLRITHKTLSKAASARPSQFALGFPMQISSKNIGDKASMSQLPFIDERSRGVFNESPPKG